MTGTLVASNGVKIEQTQYGYSEEASTLQLPVFRPRPVVDLRREDGQLVPFYYQSTERDREGDVTEVIYRSASGHKLTVWND